VTSWAYQAPEVRSAVAEPVYEAGRTSQSNAVVELKIRGTDDTQAYRLVERDQRLDRTGDTTTVRLDVAPGPQNLTVVPISRFEPPITGTSDGASTVASVTAAGAPGIGGIDASASTNTSILVSGGGVEMNSSTRASEVRYIAWQGGEPRCSVSPSGGGLTVSGGIVSESTTISGLQEYEQYSTKACASNGYGIAETRGPEVWTYVNAPAPPGASYRVSPTPNKDGAFYAYRLERAPQLELPNRFEPQFSVFGGWESSFRLDAERITGSVLGRGCRFAGMYCTGETSITAETAPNEVTVQFPTQQCIADPKSSDVRVSNSASGSAQIAPSTDGTTVTYVVTFTGAFSSLASITHTVPACAPPEPEPELPEQPGEPNPGGGGTPTTP
jgi:hypothetical protein